jgi:hypothetical protein
MDWLSPPQDQFPELRQEKCRDPYPTIGEKAFGRLGRHASTVCIMGVQYGTGVGFIILMAKFMDNIFFYLEISGPMTLCRWRHADGHIETENQVDGGDGGADHTAVLVRLSARLLVRGGRAGHCDGPGSWRRPP